jgi:LysR family glycine cleavage system transcriptional activator
MSRTLPSLKALRAFEAAARHLSFSRAADELGVTQGAVSRQIKALEEYLGVVLFRRLTRALDLTEAGREYHLSMRDAFDRMERATLHIANRGERQVLTVSVLPTFAMRWLMPRLSSFIEAEPAIEVRFITSILPVSFGHEDIDVAIRVGVVDATAADDGKPRIDLRMTDDWSGVRADRIGPDVLVAVCSPALRVGKRPLQAPRDLARCTLLHTTTRPNAWPDWFRAVGMTPIKRENEPAFGHFFMTMQAAAEGRGVAVVPEVLVGADLAAGTLVKPFDLRAESAGAYFLLCRRHQWDLPKISAFRQWLLDQAAQSMASV